MLAAGLSTAQVLPRPPALAKPTVTSGFQVEATGVRSGWAEITAAALAPGQNASCPKGRLFFASGATVRATEVDGTALFETSMVYGETPNPYVIYDNQIAKLANGDLLHTVEAVTWADVADKPGWWQQTVEYPVKKVIDLKTNAGYPGGRGTIYVFHSTDCGSTWTRLSSIDAATLAVRDPAGSPDAAPVRGLCGTPRLKEERNASGAVTSKYADAGGWDGHTLYVDPYGTGIYVTTSCTYGSDQVNVETDIALAVRSTDQGKTWSALGAVPSGTVWSWRAAISSRPDGRVAFGFVAGPKFKIAVTQPNMGNTNVADLHDVYAYTQAGNVLSFNFSGMAGYPGLVPDFAGDGFKLSGYDWRNGSVLTFKHYAIGHDFKPRALATVAGALDQQHVYQGTFVPGPANDSVHVFYWLERYYKDKRPIDASDEGYHDGFRVRFNVYQGNRALLIQPGYLSVRLGLPYAWVYEGDFGGDYMAGDSYLDKDGSRVFVLPWSENGGLRFNLVRVAPGHYGLPAKIGPVRVIDMLASPKRASAVPTLGPSAIHAPEPHDADRTMPGKKKD